ncbi:hypothetical protein R3P38DRAFT_643227 [Favolaschia claudopus]|uniref:Uncharacterized protein n=1 Tax=Favolaschia claudopus TaxID=2862362 RepID=A0AAV9Z5N0_9AGAR
MAGITTTVLKGEEDSESKFLLATKSVNPASQKLAAAARALSEAHKALAFANSIPDASMASLEESNQKLHIQVAKLTVSLKEERTRADALEASVEEMKGANEALKGEVEALKEKELAELRDEAETVEKLDELAGEMHARTAALMKKLSATKSAGGTAEGGLKRKAAEPESEPGEGIATTGARGLFAGVVIPAKRLRIETQKLPASEKRVRFRNPVKYPARLTGPRRSTSPSLSNQPSKAFAPLLPERRGSPVLDGKFSDARYLCG